MDGIFQMKPFLVHCLSVVLTICWITQGAPTTKRQNLLVNFVSFSFAVA